ncbi:cuticle protein 10.9-like [Haemaphysalis longicornis]
MAKMMLLLALLVVVVTVVRAQQPQGDAYNFRYDVKYPEGDNHFHEETSDANGARQGSYGFQTKEGQFVNVKYTADDKGYNPVVESNVPGASRTG